MVYPHFVILLRKNLGFMGGTCWITSSKCVSVVYLSLSSHDFLIDLPCSIDDTNTDQHRFVSMALYNEQTSSPHTRTLTEHWYHWSWVLVLSWWCCAGPRHQMIPIMGPDTMTRLGSCACCNLDPYHCLNTQ